MAAYISKNKQIKLNYRTLGRIMKKLGLVCRIRKAKRTKESKNVAVTFQNIASLMMAYIMISMLLMLHTYLRQ
ncbi:hypothetical protein CH322_03760 [Mycoplasmopsis bovis]|nr:hypothetical protein CH322_03760 [Mycoplasmopsis bovis]